MSRKRISPITWRWIWPDLCGRRCAYLEIIDISPPLPSGLTTVATYVCGGCGVSYELREPGG